MNTTNTEKKHYAKRDPESQGIHYINHVSAMTTEGLHAKSAIAAELAHRDIEIERLRVALASPAQPVDLEPVAAQSRFLTEKGWGTCTLEHHLYVKANPAEWPGYETRALYAAPQPAAPAQAVPASVIMASVMRDDGGEHPAFCLMVAYRAEKDAMAALAMLTDDPTQASEYPPLVCDYCGALTPDPWHSSGMLHGKMSKHIHSCDACVVEAEVQKQDEALIWLMLVALEHHTQQTRPIARTDDAITAARLRLESKP